DDSGRPRLQISLPAEKRYGPRRSVAGRAHCQIIVRRRDAEQPGGRGHVPAPGVLALSLRADETEIRTKFENRKTVWRLTPLHGGWSATGFRFSVFGLTG